MRRNAVIGILGLAAIVVSGCGGSTGTFKNSPRPPAPINITGVVSDSRVMVSPSSFGAGPITLYVTNSASQSISLTVRNSQGSSVAALQSVNPDTPGEVKFDIAPGDYQVVADQPGIKAAELHVGKERSSASNAVLQP
jgi:hypothetical protein